MHVLRRPRDAIVRTRALGRGELEVAEAIRRRLVGGGAARDVSPAGDFLLHGRVEVERMACRVSPTVADGIVYANKAATTDTRCSPARQVAVFG